jgi:hypothetical protein
MVNTLENRWSIVGYDHMYISPTWPASVARVAYTVPAIATPHYRNGNIFDYIRFHSNVDRLELLYQASSALTHIHSKDEVHGNVCPVSSPRRFFWFLGFSDKDELRKTCALPTMGRCA